MAKKTEIGSSGKGDSAEKNIADCNRLINELQLTNEFNRELLKKIAEGLIILDGNNEINYANQYIMNLLGRDIDEIYGEDFSNFIAVDYIENYHEKLRAGKESEHEIECLHSSGAVQHVKVKYGNLTYKEEYLKFLSIEDLSERKKFQLALRESGIKFRKMIENSNEVIAVIDEDGIIQYISDSSEKVFGYSPYELASDCIYDYVHVDDKKEVIGKFIASNVSSETELRFRHKNGHWIEAGITAINTIEDPVINGILINISDITGLKKAEELAAHYQLYDARVTKLPNVELLKTRIQLEIVKVQERRQDNMFAILSIGLDNFKKLTILYGTNVGDMLLRRIGQRLQGAYRGDDIVARYSGDVFMILLSYIARPYDIKDIIMKTITIFEYPFVVDNNKISLTAGIGISIFPNDGEFVELLINNSLSAMHRAKEQGPGSYCLFDSKLHQDIVNNLELESELSNAVENREFIAHYQPKVDSNGDVVGVETLIRWNSPKRGLIPPGLFIPLVEKNRMIIDIGYMIFREACEKIKKWDGMGFSKRIGINFAPAQFKDPNLIENIEKIIFETSVDINLLEFEITESGIMENARVGMLKLFKIQSMGIKIAMDDFGTGLSSLSNLIAYPIDTLKIDKSFVDKLPHNEEAKIVVNSIVSLAKNLGYDVVAEGVENKKQLEYLKEINCNQFQGFYYCRPIPDHEFEKRYVINNKSN